jgi:hypothetical protein
MTSALSLNGLKMHVVSTAEVGEVNRDTIVDFSQEGSIISARYTGGKVRLGFLVGTINGRTGSFRYAQVDNEGHIDGGTSSYEIERTDAGRMRLVEHFKWDSRPGSGTNIFEELS